MLPILFRIPLPQTPLMVWWALAALVAASVLYAGWMQRKREAATRNNALLLAGGAAALAYVLRGVSFTASGLPIYSYGVALGLSLVIGWYLVLALSKRDKLAVDAMANAYVIAAVVGLACSRLLYVATNWNEFHALSDVFALRRGGLVAYGGFIGAFVGSVLYVHREKLKVLPWLDVGAPALAAGLTISRIGCYVYGCDYGKRLSDTAPAWLQRLGTFPHWVGAAAEAGDGSPAFAHHRDLAVTTVMRADLFKRDASFPVHPAQLYEAMLGLALLALLFWLRPRRAFKGQSFFVLVVVYGVARFGLEYLRDDPERRMWGPLSTSQWLAAATTVLSAVLYGVYHLRAVRRRAEKAARAAAKVALAEAAESGEPVAEPAAADPLN
jgi:phosphatidylglycerol---prolipoprotein diacylglyceryl transferase